jgi:hypothetical protein
MLNLRVFDIENTYTGVMNYFLISLHKWWLSLEVLEREKMFFSSSVWWSWKFTLIFEEKIKYFIGNPIMRSIDLWKKHDFKTVKHLNICNKRAVNSSVIYFHTQFTFIEMDFSIDWSKTIEINWTEWNLLVSMNSIFDELSFDIKFITNSIWKYSGNPPIKIFFPT